MAIRNWAVQTLEKLAEDSACSVKKAKELPSANADSDSLCLTLKRLFLAKSGKGYGTLTMQGEHKLISPWLKEWWEEKIPFQRLVEEGLDILQERLGTVPAVTQSYCLWTEEVQGEQRFLYLFIVESSVTNVVNQDFALEPIEHFDPQTLNFAIRLDMTTLFGNQSENSTDAAQVYLARGQRKLAEAACIAFGFTSKIDIRKDTETVLEGIERYATNLDHNQAQTFKRKALEFCQEQDKIGEAVDIDELSINSDEHNPQAFAHFFRNELPGNASALRPDSRKLKQLVRFAGRGQGVSLSFSSEVFNQSVVYDEQQDTLVITEIPKALKAQLKRYMEQQEEPNEQDDSD